MTMMTMKPRNRRRMQLLLVAAVFAIPPIAAMVLGALGWQPGTRSHGQPILPQRSLGKVAIRTAGGGSWAWRDSEPRMSLVALPGPGCASQCLQTLKLMRNARITLNKNMNRLRLLYLGTPPTGEHADEVLRSWTVGKDVDHALAKYRTDRPDTVSALLVESNGTALSWYPPDFDPNGLRKDLQKVIR